MTSNRERQRAGMARATEARKRFCTACLTEVMPTSSEDRLPKRILFRQASMVGMERSDRPRYFRSARQLEKYIRHNWRVIRNELLPTNHDILPCYVNGPTFGGGGFHTGNVKLARKQVDRDGKIAQGVVDSANEFARATNQIFPQVAAPHPVLVMRPAVTRR